HPVRRHANEGPLQLRARTSPPGSARPSILTPREAAACTRPAGAAQATGGGPGHDRHPPRPVPVPLTPRRSPPPPPRPAPAAVPAPAPAPGRVRVPIWVSVRPVTESSSTTPLPPVCTYRNRPSGVALESTVPGSVAVWPSKVS